LTRRISGADCPRGSSESLAAGIGTESEMNENGVASTQSSITSFKRASGGIQRFQGGSGEITEAGDFARPKNLSCFATEDGESPRRVAATVRMTVQISAERVRPPLAFGRLNPSSWIERLNRAIVFTRSHPAYVLSWRRPSECSRMARNRRSSDVYRARLKSGQPLFESCKDAPRIVVNPGKQRKRWQ